MWLLARTADAANLQELNLSTGKIGLVVPESRSADSVAQLSSGTIGVGLGTATSGALELRDSPSGALTATVPIGAPAQEVVAGTDGSTFYVLNGGGASRSVTLVDATTQRTSITIPVPLDTIAIAIGSSDQDLYALESSGTLNDITIATGVVGASFKVGSGPVALSVSPTGGTLYILRSIGSGTNVSVVDVQTEGQRRALGAPADAIGLQVSADGHSLYEVVGTATYGNVQVFPTGD